jgi:hypothetical protein
MFGAFESPGDTSKPIEVRWQRQHAAAAAFMLPTLTRSYADTLRFWGSLDGFA